MEKLYFKNYQFILGSGILLIGVILFAVLSGPVRYFGIVSVLFAILYIANLFYSRLGEPGHKTFRSRTREQILKHQYKK